MDAGMAGETIRAAFPALDAPWTWVASGLAILGVAVLLGLARDRRRTRTLAEVAARLGLAFRREDPRLLDAVLPRAPILRAGHGRRARNVVRGEGLVVFDLRYVAGTGRGRHVHRLTVGVLTTGGRPRVRALPAGRADRSADGAALVDVDPGSDAAPGRTHRVRAENARAARAWLDAGLRDWLVAHPGWVVDSSGRDGWLVAHRDGDRLDPPALPAFVDALRDLQSIPPEAPRFP
jgi:hypothetical protein